MAETRDDSETLFVTLSWCPITQQVRKTYSPALSHCVDDIARDAVPKMLRYLATAPEDQNCRSEPNSSVQFKADL